VDGNVNDHELLTDLVGTLAVNQTAEGLFHPGETRTENFRVKPGLKDIHAHIDSVTYADQTSETSNAEGLKRLVVHRKADIAATQLANKIIKAALADPNDADPAAKKIQEQITLWNAQRHTSIDLEPGTLWGVIDDLKVVSRESNKRDALNQYVTKSEQKISTLAPHAGGPQ